MEKKTNINNSSSSTKSSYNQIHSKNPKTSSNYPSDSNRQIRQNQTIAKNKILNPIVTNNNAISQTISNDNNIQNYSQHEPKINEIYPPYYHQIKTSYNAINEANHYQCQPTSNYFKAKNQLQPIVNNQFQGENYHPNMINQKNIPFSNYPNMVRNADYQGQINNLINIINNMNNKMNDMKKEYNLKMEGYEFKMNDMKKEYENKLNNAKDEMKTEYQNKIDSVLGEVKQTNFKLEKGLKEMELNIGELSDKLNINNLIEDELIGATKKIINLLDEMLINSEKINNILNNSLENKSKEINKLKKEVSFMKEKINFLESLLIGRKLLKILLKTIFENCFYNFSLSPDYTIAHVIYKNQKYVNMKGVANRILTSLLKTNRILHIDGKNRFN